MPAMVASEDFIENNIQNYFFKPHKSQFILGSIRVIIKNGAVELPNKKHNLYTFVIVLFTFLTSVYYEIFYYHAMYHHNLIMFCACFAGVAGEFSAYATNIYMARFANKDLNIRLYYMLQKIDRILQLTSDTYYTEFMAKVQNTRITLLAIFFPIGYACHSWSIAEKPIYTLFLVIGLLSVYMDLLLFDGILYFITVRLSIFNQMLKNHVNKYEPEQPRKKSRSLRQIIVSRLKPDFDRIDTTLEWEKWPECIQTTLQSYRMLNTIFEYPLMNSVIVLVLWTLVAIAGMVLGRQSGLYPMLATAMIALWVAYSAIILCSHAILADWITYEFKQAKKLCVRIMFYCDDPYRKAASKVLRNIHYSRPKFVLYGIVELSSNLPLTVFGIIATNVLVVIQFFVEKH